MIGRRMFMKAASIIPMAAKKMAEEEAKKLINVGRGEDAALLSDGVGLASRYYDDDNDGNPVKKRHEFMRGYLKLWGKVPDFMEEDLRDRSKHVYCLDPDIAVKCWSLNVKIQHQIQRNYQNHITRYERSGWMTNAQERFKELTGFKWER